LVKGQEGRGVAKGGGVPGWRRPSPSPSANPQPDVAQDQDPGLELRAEGEGVEGKGKGGVKREGATTRTTSFPLLCETKNEKKKT